MFKRLILGLSLACAIAAGAADVTIEKPYFRWLFNGFGFQNSEANFLEMMPDDFRDQRVLKTFAELSPTFGRVYTGFAEQSREQLDRFADYYDLTFRKAGTTLYAVPCAMPAIRSGDNAQEYAEKVAANLEYLIKVRKCVKIRYYCISNELMVGDQWDWFTTQDKWDVFRDYNEALYDAFRRHGLDIKLLATDKAVTTKPAEVVSGFQWTMTNMNSIVGAYCSHWYVYGRKTADLDLWNEYNTYFTNLVQMALRKNRRYILGEYSFHPAWGKRGVMKDDVSYHLRQPETQTESVLCKCELGLAAMNAGALACVDWSFVDYPDPFIIEDGDSHEEKVRYAAGRTGWEMEFKYNKCGVFRWCTTDRDYSSYAELYAMGWLVKLFRKNATVLPCTFADSMIRGGAVINPDQSVSIALINRGSARSVTVDCAAALKKPLRRYVYDSANVPYSPFNDLQACSGTVLPSVEPSSSMVTVDLPAKSMTFLTTDYQERLPDAVVKIRIIGDRLTWFPSEDPHHRYYRVFRNGKQIASTIATELPVEDLGANYDVKSVDQWGNVR